MRARDTGVWRFIPAPSVPRPCSAQPTRTRWGCFSRRVLVAALLGATAVALPAGAADVASRTLLLDATVAGNTVVAVGERGTILRSTDSGLSWRECPDPSSATLTAVSFCDPSHGWAVGHDATIEASTDGGTTWTKQWQGENLADSFLDVLAVDPAHVIAVGAYGLFLSTGDGGRTWVRRKVLEDDYHLNRISRGPTGTLYLAGEHGTLLKSIDGGAQWSDLHTSYDGSFYGILPLGPQALLAYGLRGRLFRSDDDGENWSAVLAGRTALLATAVKLKDGTVAVAGQIRAILVSRNDGVTFARYDAGVATGVSELLELPDGNLLAVGEAGASRIDLARLRETPNGGGEPRRSAP